MVFPQPGAGVNPTVVNVTDPQLSVAAAPANELNQAVKFAPLVARSHSMTSSMAGVVNTGGVVSSISMVCSQVAVLPQLSVAVQVRVMVSSCGHAPGMEASL